MIRALVFLLLAALPASRLDAACVLELRYENGAIRWDRVIGARSYQLQESADGMVTSRNFSLTPATTSFPVTHRASMATKFRYVVTVVLDAGVLTTASADSCTEDLEITLEPDAAFRALTRRAVIPAAGSTAGANGAKFKTSLRLISTAGNQRGRIVFHPAGRNGAAADPSIRYEFSSVGELRFFDDVVAEMGATGIGSLDIIPDDDSDAILPRIEARLFNDTDLGTFGSLAAVVYPYDFLRPAALVIDVPDARFRVNLGIRTFTAASGQALIYGSNGRLRAIKELSFPAEYMTLTTPIALLGTDLLPGESVTIGLGGAAVPFYTVTENRTNDATLIVPPPRSGPVNVGSYLD